MHKTPEITRLIHENFSTVLYFVFGQPAITTVLNARFAGEPQFLTKTVYERAEIIADRALLEMATQMRVLDDAENLNDTFKKYGANAFGVVTQADGTKTALYFRDMTNKIMHASYFKWDMSVPNDPKVICLPHDGGRWSDARIDIVALMTLMAHLIH